MDLHIYNPTDYIFTPLNKSGKLELGEKTKQIILEKDLKK
jgi:hypothetical protein